MASIPINSLTVWLLQLWGMIIFCTLLYTWSYSVHSTYVYICTFENHSHDDVCDREEQQSLPFHLRYTTLHQQGRWHWSDRANRRQYITVCCTYCISYTDQMYVQIVLVHVHKYMPTWAMYTQSTMHNKNITFTSHSEKAMQGCTCWTGPLQLTSSNQPTSPAKSSQFPCNCWEWPKSA